MMLDIYLIQFAIKGKTRRSAVGDLRVWAADRLGAESDAFGVDGELEDGEQLHGRWYVEGPSENPTAIDVAVTRRTDDGLVVAERVEILSAKSPLVRGALSVGGVEGRRRPFDGGVAESMRRLARCRRERTSVLHLRDINRIETSPRSHRLKIGTISVETP